MGKNKLFLSILIAFIVFFLGTSLAFGIIYHVSDKVLEEDLPPIEDSTADGDDGLGLDQEAPDDEQDDPNEANDDAEEAKDEEDTVDAPPGEDSSSETETDAAKKPAPQPKEQQLAWVTATALNVRPDPSSDNQPIGVLLLGQTVEVIAEQGNWLQVKLPDGRLGWISGAYVHRFSSGASGSLAGRVIVIDPGHGGRDPGAVGVSGLLEKEVNLDVSLRVAEMLRALGAKVIMTRDTDVFLSLAQRVSIAEAASAEVFVSVHANAHPNPLIGGTETYYFGKKSTSNASVRLAAFLQRELAGALQLRDIGAKEASFHVIRETSMPSALLELAFLSNAQEESLMRRNDFRQNAADAIVRALQDYFN